MGLEACRGRRRRITETLAFRRWSDYVFLFLDGDASSSKWARTSPRYWTSDGIGNCNCRKRCHGQPRIAAGMCCLGNRTRNYRLRAQVLDLQRAVLRGEDPDGDLLSLLEPYAYINRRY